MNVMVQAHKATRKALAQLAENVVMTYAAMFKLALKQAHKEIKAMQAQKTIKLDSIYKTLCNNLHATGFGLQGTVTDSEGNKVNVGEFSGSEMKIQNDADYYMSIANGFTKQELFVVMWDLEDAKESFKIIR